MTLLRAINRYRFLALCAAALLTLALLTPMVTNAQSMYDVVKWIGLSIVMFFGWLAGLAGVLLEYSINYLVIGMGKLIRVDGFGGPINALWGVVRDLVNLTFIFGLIYIGFKVILQNWDTGMKRAIAGIIVGAILVNFSLFFAKAVIDVANITAIQVYKTLNPEAGAGNTKGITERFFAYMGVHQLITGGAKSDQIGREISTRIANRINKDGTPTTSGSPMAFMLIFSLGASIFLIKAMFAFATGAILLAIRFVVLIFLMILSPIAFAASVLPGIDGLSRKWWLALLSQAFMAPVFLFMLYLTMTILGSSSSIYGSNQNGGNDIIGLFVEGSTKDQIGMALFFIIACIAIAGSAIVAKKMASAGSDLGVKYTEKFTGWAGKNMRRAALAPVKNVSSLAGRKTVGWAADKGLSINKKLEGTRWGRNVKRFGITPLSLGMLDERGRQSVGESLKKAKFGGSYSFADDEKFTKDQKRVRNMEERKQKRANALAELEKAQKQLKQHETDRKFYEEQYGALSEAERREHDAKRAQYEASIPALEKAAKDEVEKMTLTELEEEGVDELKKIAHLLSNRQMDQLKDSKELNEGEKDAVKGARKTEFLTRFEKDAEGFLKGMKPQDIAKLHRDIIFFQKAGASAEDNLKYQKTVVKYMAGEVVHKLQDEASLSPADVQKLTELMETLPEANASGVKRMRSPRGQGYWPVTKPERGGESEDGEDTGQTPPRPQHRPFQPPSGYQGPPRKVR